MSFGRDDLAWLSNTAKAGAAKVFGKARFLGGNALRKGVEACSNQALTPGAICALLLSLYVGRTVDISEAIQSKFKFGEDPKTSELVIKLQRATKGSSTPKTLPKLWEAGSFDEMQTWFNDLVREAGFSVIIAPPRPRRPSSE